MKLVKQEILIGLCVVTPVVTVLILIAYAIVKRAIP